MKKLIPLLLLIFVFTFSFIGCSQGNDSSDKSETTGTEESGGSGIVDENGNVESNPGTAGGVGESTDVSDEDIALFNEALGSEAKHYQPISVQTQVVAGMNYFFRAQDLTKDKEIFVTKHLN